MTLNDKQNNTLISPSIGGGGNNQQQNLERRNRGLSLLNQTAAHFIYPSRCDNTTSLNDINLQLHASSTVSNPYTFSISSNTSFGANIEPEVPTELTYLYRDIYPEDSSFPSIGAMPVVIPAGVTVIRFALGGNASQDDEPCSCSAVNAATGKTWVDYVSNGAVGRIVYVGVTPGKAYNIEYGVESEIEIVDYSCAISYSKQINTHTPDIEDY